MATETITPSSSWVSEITYDDDAQVMTIHTKQNRAMAYEVSPDVWAEAKEATSIGVFLNQRVIGVLPRVL